LSRGSQLLPTPQKRIAGYSEEFDFEKSNSRFDKLKVFSGITDGNKTEEALIDLPLTKAYNKNSGFFDSISCESLEALDLETSKSKTGGKSTATSAQRSFSEQKRIDDETFGQPPRSGGGGRSFSSYSSSSSSSYQHNPQSRGGNNSNVWRSPAASSSSTSSSSTSSSARR